MIRQAEQRDIPELLKLLEQISEIHHNLRPDLFPKKTKYTYTEIQELLFDETQPIFVFDESGNVEGYVFCKLVDYSKLSNCEPVLTLYIDDICVREDRRGRHIGSSLFEYVKDYARSIGCHNLTLNVWEGNDQAKAFYEKMGLSVQRSTLETIL